MAEQRFIAHFTPEAWIRDNAIEADAEGDQEWDCTEAFNALDGDYRQQLLDRMAEEGDPIDRDDALRGDPRAPKWVRRWSGPFTIRVRMADSTDISEGWDPEDPDTKGEMVFVYRTDLQELLTWLSQQGLNLGKLNPRQAEAWNALQAKRMVMTKYRITVNATVDHTYEIDLPDGTDEDDVVAAFYELDNPTPVKTVSVNWEVVSVEIANQPKETS